jgi:hypothetical protein
MMSWPLFKVDGAFGCSGGIACKIEILSDGKLYPAELIASTVN